MTDVNISTLEKAIRIAHEIKILRIERPKFETQLSEQQWESVDWVVKSFSIDPSICISTGNWKNNYAKTVELVQSIISLLPRLEKKLQKQENLTESINDHAPEAICLPGSSPKMATSESNQENSSFSEKQRAELANIVAQGITAALRDFSLLTLAENKAKDFNTRFKTETNTNTWIKLETKFQQSQHGRFYDRETNFNDNQSNTFFRAKDIGYFDPDTSKPAVEIRDTHNIYHNVFSFTNRLRVKRSTDNSIVRNLDECLLGEANQWYIEEISQIMRNGLRVGTIEDWCNILEKRFCESPGKALIALEKLRYTVQDVRD
ncbi:hypothetical protein OnM2_073031b [Erysiphe neolycopersici]|uniref:Uncharacterized protein n=1 Tax=Erysiphe neolycopersici TaxID=212602 RepID=A0A420HJD4_9PEZI|nr:hypothetical protein OnM2_073031b [Erysiphe neolycopersici]